MLPDLNLSSVEEFLPSLAQVGAASESVVEGVRWIGGIGLRHNVLDLFWKGCQALYELEWRNITLENVIQLVSFELLAGMLVILTILLSIKIFKKWKGRPTPSEKKTTFRTNNEPKKALTTNSSKLYTWIQKVISKIPMSNSLKQKCQQLIKKEETSTYFRQTNKLPTQEIRPGRNSFFTPEKTKSAPIRSASVQRIRYRSEEEVQDSFSRGTIHRLSQFEPGKINAKLTNIFERRSPPPKLQKPPKLRLVTPEQVFRKNLYAHET